MMNEQILVSVENKNNFEELFENLLAIIKITNPNKYEKYLKLKNRA